MAERVSVLPVHEDRVASIEVEAILVVGIHKAGIKENNEVVVLVESYPGYRTVACEKALFQSQLMLPPKRGFCPG